MQKLNQELRFSVGQKVRVKLQSPGATRRTPDYIRGKVGIVFAIHGSVPGYEYDHADDWGPLYTVVFDSKEVFGHSENEKILIDLHEPWLEPSE